MFLWLYELVRRLAASALTNINLYLPFV
jgi:hypothetical protein